MTASKFLIVFLVVPLLFGCKGPTEVKVADINLTDVKDGPLDSLPPPPSELKVSAYLIYKDSTTSTFDVLNDKNIALWNTIIGAGDAGKASEKTRVVLIGKLDGLKVTVCNGKRKVINKKLPDLNGKYELVVDNTGCEKVKVIVTKLDKVVYQDNIPFECGE